MEDKTPLTAEEMLCKYDLEFWRKSGPMHECMHAFVAQQTASLQERVKELERENAELKGKFTGTFLNELVASESWKSVEEANGLSAECIVKLARCQQLNEKLMGLLEVQYKCNMKYATLSNSEEKLNNWWQSYRQEKGI